MSKMGTSSIGYLMQGPALDNASDLISDLERQKPQRLGVELGESSKLVQYGEPASEHFLGTTFQRHAIC